MSDINKPIGISEYQLIQSLPEKFKSSLPSVEELEQELSVLKNDVVKKPEKTTIDKKLVQEKKVIDFIIINKKISIKDLKELLNIDDTKAKEILKNMIDKNLIERKGIGKNTFYVLGDK